MKHTKRHISDFRTTRYRVFYASGYFRIDLEYDIKWHTKHLKKLQKHFKDPKKYHKTITSHTVDENRTRHYEEHVINSIPFHKKLLEDHKKRLKAMLEIMPARIYRKLRRLSMRLHDVPEYLVYDKHDKEFFFVSETMSPDRRRWISLVRDKYKICDVVVMIG